MNLAGSGPKFFPGRRTEKSVIRLVFDFSLCCARKQMKAARFFNFGFFYFWGFFMGPAQAPEV